MKTKSILLAAMVLVSAVAFADEPATSKLVVVSQKEAGLFKVIYENPKTTKVKMNIINSNGETLFTESLKVADGFILPVNFRGMKPGEYSIEVVDGSAKQVQKVSYGLPAASQRVHVARLTNEANKYLLSVANDGAINVKIIDGSNNVIHEQTLNVNGAVGLVYNLKAVEGTPTFEVTDGNGNTKVVRY